jgi:FAD/FMN-containing dehydrogenase
LRAQAQTASGAGVFVNDIHSKLNRTHVDRVIAVRSEGDIAAAVATARAQGKAICVAGGRHAMGGQQFATHGILLDMRSMNRIVALDAANGVVEVEAGIQWPELVAGLHAMQPGELQPWTIVQKQTGADRLSIGGALAANIHGRGLTLRPITGEVDSFSLMDGDGRMRNCSRTENVDLFRHAIGGYGLFGIITRVRLKLMRRTKIERNVRLIDVGDLQPAFAERIQDGFIYGDCQISTDPTSDTYLKTGVFSCYLPLPADAALPTAARELNEDAWRALYMLSHSDPRKAYETYTSFYLASDGQRYWSDTSQLSVYLDDYHEPLDRLLQAKHPGSEMISELYVPRPALRDFLAAVRADFRQHNVQLIYGTIRLIERDDESVLAWAREPWACTVMNLHVDHSPDGIGKAADDFRRLIDRALAQGGSYFPTYHRWASRAQVETCYPQMPDFLRAKRKHDTAEVFQSDWYRHYKTMFADRL